MKVKSNKQTKIKELENVSLTSEYVKKEGKSEKCHNFKNIEIFMVRPQFRHCSS